MYKALLLMLGIAFTTSTLAGTTSSTISKVLLYEDGMLIYVYPESGVTNPPACHNATSGGDYYSFSATRPMAKEYLSGLLAAQARKATVTLWGANACNDQSSSETLRYFRIEN